MAPVITPGPELFDIAVTPACRRWLTREVELVRALGAVFTFGWGRLENVKCSLPFFPGEIDGFFKWTLLGGSRESNFPL